MNLPIKPPFPPMEALLVDEIPSGGDWQYEPKWDGFRCLAFRDDNEVYLQSKAGQPLARYFTEVVELFRSFKAKRFVIDGEIVIPVEGRLSFDDLLMRIHPAASRIQQLSKEFPATFIVFDLLVDANAELLTSLTLAERRRALEKFTRPELRRFGCLRLQGTLPWLANGSRRREAILTVSLPNDWATTTAR